MWTTQQLQAIDAENNTILVSAAAGSGKTAVLVERIVQLIRGGFHLDRMLIVTFTKAAASEMRQRLNRRLIHEAQAAPQMFSRALDELESTEISTIHAFCQKVLRNHFQAVGIDPMVRPCDDQMRAALFDEAWLDAFNALLTVETNDDFADLAMAWDQPRLKEMTAQLYDFLMSLPKPFAWLDEQVERIENKPYTEQMWYKVQLSHAELKLQGVRTLLDAMERMLDEPNAVPEKAETLQQDREVCEPLFHVKQSDVQGMLDTLRYFSLPRAKSFRGLSPECKEWNDRYNETRKKIPPIVKELCEELDLDEAQIDTEFAMMARHLRGLAALTKVTHNNFLQKKAEKHLIDFADMEQFTMQVLSDPEIRRQMQAEYDHIFVDECQDVSQVQDAILQAIHNENNIMFMVGDVKQSIYRFRKADPTLFLHRLRTYSDDVDAPCRRIILQKNFRSRANVLEATNEVFRTVMRPTVTELTYSETDELTCGRETENDPQVEMHLLDIEPGEDGEKVEALNAEAEVVIQRVKELLETDFNDGKTSRKYTYRDMVILLSAASNTAPKLVELLGQAGIPVFYDGAASYYDLPEVRSVKELLAVIDNPMQDLPLLATLKLAPFSMSEAELAQIRMQKTGRDVPFYEAFDAACEGEDALGEKCRGIRKQLADWRFQAETMRLSDFVWHIMQDSGLYACVGALPQGELRQANLRMLYQRAQAFEQDGGETLSDFLRMAEQQSAGDDRMSAKMLGENENLLRIMTMHKSKGLEFPVVFCMQMSGALHKPYRGELLMHTALGLAMPYVNQELRIKRKTVMDAAFKVQRELDEKAERARLLYVAMTRARERLIMVGCCKKKTQEAWSLGTNDYAVWNARSMTDWIMLALDKNIHKLSTSSAQAQTPWNIRLWSDLQGVAVDTAVDKVCTADQLLCDMQMPASEAFAHWAWQKAPSATPVKTSVSAIAKRQATKDPMPLTDQEEEPETKRVQEEIVAPLRMSDLPSRPAFMEEHHITGAERGTLTHRALSLIPLEQMRQAEDLEGCVREAMQQLADREIFTYQELMVMDQHGIAGFFRGELGQRMLRSGNVRREWAFNLVMEGSGTLLQGVIDCAFEEDGEWVLVDYKTDRIADEDAFVARYQLQLAWYARALETITGKRVKEKYLYAIGKAKVYPMETDCFT